MRFIPSPLALGAVLWSGLAAAEPATATTPQALTVATLSAPLSTIPRAPLAMEVQATPAPAPQAQPEQYRIAVSHVTSPALVISQTAPELVTPAAFAAPPAGPQEEPPAPPPAPRRGPFAGHFPPPPPGPMDLASLLAAQEIALGIRADQLDAWRSYAAAVVDMADLGPPEAPKADEPLALSQMIATRALAEAKKAQVVLETRAALLAKLSPPQIETARKLTPPRPPQAAPDAPR